MATTVPNILKETYRSGQILQAEDFLIEQEFHIQHRQFQTRHLLSSGILIGLEVTTSANSLDVASGAAVDQNGEQLLLTATKSLDVAVTDGDYHLLMLENLANVAEKPHQLKSDPDLKLVPASETYNSGVLLAFVSILNGIYTVKAGPQAEILAIRLPKQELDASEILTFYADKTVIKQGETVQFNWKINPNVDNLVLEYFSDSDLINKTIKSEGPVSFQSEFSLQPNQTTTYTLTAKTTGVVVAQEQLIITVVTIRNLVENSHQNNKAAKEVIALVNNLFPSASPYDSASALAKAGYSFSDTGIAIRAGYNSVNPTEFGKIMAFAFPSK